MLRRASETIQHVSIIMYSPHVELFCIDHFTAACIWSIQNPETVFICSLLEIYMCKCGGCVGRRMCLTELARRNSSMCYFPTSLLSEMDWKSPRSSRNLCSGWNTHKCVFITVSANYSKFFTSFIDFLLVVHLNFPLHSFWKCPHAGWDRLTKRRSLHQHSVALQAQIQPHLKC